VKSHQQKIDKMEKPSLYEMPLDKALSGIEDVHFNTMKAFSTSFMDKEFKDIGDKDKMLKQIDEIKRSFDESIKKA